MKSSTKKLPAPRGSAFAPNEVPSISAEHLSLVRAVRRDLTSIAKEAYPKAYQPGFEGRPKLVIPEGKRFGEVVNELEGIVDIALDKQTVAHMIEDEGRTRPIFEETFLKILFETLLPIITDGHKVLTLTPLQYGIAVDARCMRCLKEERYKSGAGFLPQQEYVIEKSVALDDILSGEWRNFAVTDVKLASDDTLRIDLTPSCGQHGKRSVVQLALVHRIAPAQAAAKPGYRNGKRTPQPAEVRQPLPILEARLKTTFEYLWKYAKYLQGQKEGIPDAFAALVRTADENSLVRTIIQMLKASPLIWPGAIKPQNYENFGAWVKEHLGGSNGDWTYFRDRVEQHVIPEARRLVKRRGGIEQPAQYVELFFPSGNASSVEGSNAMSFLGYTDEEYTRINGTQRQPSEGQSRLDYQRRREASKKETSTLLDWMITLRLAGLSLDPSSVAYNWFISYVRYFELLGTGPNKSVPKGFESFAPSTRS